MVDFLNGKDLAKLVEGLLSVEKQVRSESIDLTVKEVYSLSKTGSLDFGGSEYTMPDRVKKIPKSKEDEEYGWWKLSEGTYLVALNETVKEIESIGFISPHPRLLTVGCTHPTLVTKKWDKEYILPLNVSEQGLRLKENARISKLFVLK